MDADLADGFATRFVQSENGCRFYLRTSASSADSSSVRTSERERVPLLSAYICVICGFVLGTNGSHQCSFAARPDYPQMDADLRRWLRDKVRSARERGPLLSAYICVICGFVPSVRTRRINVRSPRDLIIRKWTQIYANGFATRFVQSENGCRFYLRTSA